MKKERIRQRDILITGGRGVCLFGLWSVIRVVMSIITDAPDIQRLLEQTESSLARGSAIIGVLIAAAFAMAIHLYIGLSSRAEGFRPRNKNAYIVVTIIFFILQVIAFGFDVFFYDFTHNGYIDYAVTLFMDLTLLITLVGIVIASFRLRWLQKRMRDGRNE